MHKKNDLNFWKVFGNEFVANVLCHGGLVLYFGVSPLNDTWTESNPYEHVLFCLSVFSASLHAAGLRGKDGMKYEMKE